MRCVTVKKCLFDMMRAICLAMCAAGCLWVSGCGGGIESEPHGVDTAAEDEEMLQTEEYAETEGELYK